MQKKMLCTLIATTMGVMATTPLVLADTAAAPVAKQARQVISKADELPRRSYVISKLPSELIEGAKGDMDAVLAALDKDLADDLAQYDIRDRATRTGMLSARAQIATYRGDYAQAATLLREVREQQEKAADKLLSGVSSEAILLARQQGGNDEKQKAAVKARLAAQWGGMPWDVVGDSLKGAKGSLELMSRNVVMGSIKNSLDPAASNLKLNVPASVVTGIVSVRNMFDHTLVFRDDMVAVLQQLVDKNQVVKQDLWSPRLVSLPAEAKASPVVVGIWDSGTDVDLFKTASVRGIAFDHDAKLVPALVRPMGEAASRMGSLKQYMKGSLDMRAAIDSPEAKLLKQRIGTLQQGEVKQFQEDLGALGMWVHGTHVAGIAVEGNPFARVTAVGMHWSHSIVPQLPTEERAKRTAAAYQAAVESFRKAGTRVVNMSWRYGPGAYEGALAYHNVGKTPEERKQMANKLFEIEKQALESAMKGAPDILFVAGAGNEDNSADFAQYIPAGLELPNLITVGAVDQAGTETGFSSFGKTVVVHANGFEVDSYMPGGEKIKLSGTSMASPQVANLAGKLFAIKPALTVAEAKALILKGAERKGRVNLINPKATLALLGQQG
ncbi:S8 family serine peptidase [Chitinimonas sp. JJ19]|uniref:S8 family serine peptidase n=1 Tax=Chitinimonas sp. JJ19 TaxID=3109352 RepID=UPI00300098C2